MSAPWTEAAKTAGFAGEVPSGGLVHDLPNQQLPMSDAQTPFDSIESAHEYVSLLISQLDGVSAGITEDVAEAQRETAGRRLDALRLVDYKLAQLKHHLSASGRILNDLRALRRLLLGERDTTQAPIAPSGRLLQRR